MRGKKSAPIEDGHVMVAENGLGSADSFLPAELCLQIHRHMVRARAMEERMIKMSKSGEGYFWLGGPGEEGFNVPLGLLIKKGFGPAFDFIHFHYRNSAAMIAMGMPLADSIRQMAMTATDPFSFGRNFPGHFCVREWNIPPVTSVVGVQWSKAIGTAHVQKRHGGDGITVVIGGDAGTQEGDFQTCLVWGTRPGEELPLLMIVTNNHWGISTTEGSQHAEKHISDRGRPFGIPGAVVDGNDPLAVWFALKKAMDYCRSERRPYLMDMQVSRLYGHSSSSGAPRSGDADCVAMFEKRLLEAGLIDQTGIEQVHADAKAETEAAVDMVLKEPRPRAEDVEKYTFADSPVDAVYPGDYTGLPNDAPPGLQSPKDLPTHVHNSPNGNGSMEVVLERLPAKIASL
jgi:2-oxoisovalerate dehydrogenase E1 component alpha subunit